jgi:hypothetical protein
MTNPSTERKDAVIREFPPVGKYRVRLLENEKAKSRVLDIREYIVGGESFEGFTRRGIRLSDRAQVDLLRDALREILESMLI